MFTRLIVVTCVVFALTGSGFASDQSSVGAGNDYAREISRKSPLVQSAMAFLRKEAAQIHDPQLKRETLDAFTNPQTCIAHRAGLTDKDKAAVISQLIDAGLVDAAAGRDFPGDLRAGIFPAVRDDGSPCPHLPQAFDAAPGSVFEGHHSYPGGLAMHEAFNDISDLSLMADYRLAYGHLAADGLPTIDLEGGAGFAQVPGDLGIDADLIISAPIWHDWAKTLVFQWNADGTEFQEFIFGGNGTTDNYGAKGDSRTPAHHIIGLAETMKRGLSPAFVITQASAHSAPTLGNEYKVVNWIRAAAIVARIDPIAKGFLTRDSAGQLRLPALRATGSFDLRTASNLSPPFLPEFMMHNLSDGNYYLAAPAAFDLGLILTKLAPEFGVDPKDRASFNNRFRNPVLAYLSAERLIFIYAREGIVGVRTQVRRLRSAGLI